MARFCDKCGTRLNDSSAFCPSCGAAVVNPVVQAAVPYQDVSPPSVPVRTVETPSYAARVAVVEPAPPAKSGSALKIILIVLVVLALGALAVVGGIVYVGHKVVTKIENKAAEVGLSRSPANNTTDTFQLRSARRSAWRFLKRRVTGTRVTTWQRERLRI
jgi:phosphate/sulfate permease